MEGCGPGVVVVSVAGASLDVVVEAERVGVGAILREPFDREALAEVARRLRVESAGTAIPRREETGGGAPRIVGSSAGMAAVFQLIARVATSPATVLIRGESGTGKELAAKAIHAASDRVAGPFVAVNCAAIPEHLLESELFGHERGAFTGAVARRRGRFERASGGTLFLDEIGDMSLVLQAKILRALEEREIERLGGESRIPVDVRVIAATNQSLPDLIARGEFREDLYYRLAVVEIELPSLRDREDDVVELALHFAGEFAARYGRPVQYLSEAAIARLRAYSWPGNVRELRNVMDRAVLLARGSVIEAEDLRLGIGQVAAGLGAGAEPTAGYPPTLSLAQVEAAHLERVLRHTGAHMGEAARILGVHRNTLTRKVKEYGIGVDARAAPEP
ncbi:MAG: sigma-54-dependent Fis family transcriptional regulator [Gemmatimonadetes bacterium]|nr:sigma-54-dependent Fis family transcriptional regulator [Gemmatimonadota bacterium]